MVDKFENETFLAISPYELSIFLFDKSNNTNLYKETLKFKDKSQEIDLNTLSNFIRSNIFKIEKLAGSFIENIFLIIENKKLCDFKLGIKNKNDEEKISKKNLINMLTEAKDIFKENNQDYKIMHIVINNYIINGKYFDKIPKNIEVNKLGLEIFFLTIPVDLILQIDEILKKFQIKAVRYLSLDFIKSSFGEKNIELSEKASKILMGHNVNEIILIQKNTKSSGFFEKFFQLFS